MAITDDQVAALRSYLSAGTDAEAGDAERQFLTLARTGSLDGVEVLVYGAFAAAARHLRKNCANPRALPGGRDAVGPQVLDGVHRLVGRLQRLRRTITCGTEVHADAALDDHTATVHPVRLRKSPIDATGQQ